MGLTGVKVAPCPPAPTPLVWPPRAVRVFVVFVPVGFTYGYSQCPASGNSRRHGPGGPRYPTSHLSFRAQRGVCLFCFSAILRAADLKNGPPPVGRLRSRASATERSGPQGGGPRYTALRARAAQGYPDTSRPLLDYKQPRPRPARRGFEGHVDRTACLGCQAGSTL